MRAGRTPTCDTQVSTHLLVRQNGPLIGVGAMQVLERAGVQGHGLATLWSSCIAASKVEAFRF